MPTVLRPAGTAITEPTKARSLMSFAQTTPSTTGGTSSSLGRALRSQPSHKAKAASTKSRMKKL